VNKGQELARLISVSAQVSPVIDFDPLVDKLAIIDLSVNNESLSDQIYCDIESFSLWINGEILGRDARYGIGGYKELRKIYAKSHHFDGDEEPRRLHLGMDIWAPAESLIYSALDGKVHSFRYNGNDGDYGGTIITEHEIEGLKFFILYGHLSFTSIELAAGSVVRSGQPLGVLGKPSENGNWPPHLHFQIIFDLQGLSGDYPGVCKSSEASRFLSNCPDPNIILLYSLK
jgi:peptidoglycan LD-endopeptidase LytH